MTDLYIRRGDARDVRRRAGLIGLLVVVLCVAGGFVAFRSCRPAPNLADQETGESVGGGSAAEEPGLETAESARDTTSSERSDPPSAPPTEDLPPLDGVDPGIRLVARAQQLKADGALLEAREAAWSVLDQSRHPASLDRARELLGVIHIDLVMNPHAMPEKVDYVVASGDSLSRLAKRYKTTVELLQRGNNISGSRINIGDRMRILDGAFRIEIDKSANILDLYLNDRFFKRYRVGTGEYNRTPVGDFEINDRIHQPTWWRPDGQSVPYGSEENELGTHWLSLSVRHYGIHGTWKPETIGRQASAGCVRLTNENIEELFTLVPIGTKVTITD